MPGNVHAKSRLIPETSTATPARNHGPGRACPDRTRAIPCTVTGCHRMATVVRDRRGRARCVPDRPVNAGNSRSLRTTRYPGSPAHRQLTRCAYRSSKQRVTVHVDRRPMAVKCGTKTVGLTGAESRRAKAVSQRRSTSSSTMPSASMASRAAQAGGRIPGGAVRML